MVKKRLGIFVPMSQELIQAATLVLKPKLVTGRKVLLLPAASSLRVDNSTHLSIHFPPKEHVR